MKCSGSNISSISGIRISTITVRLCIYTTDVVLTLILFVWTVIVGGVLRWCTVDNLSNCVLFTLNHLTQDKSLADLDICETYWPNINITKTVCRMKRLVSVCLENVVLCLTTKMMAVCLDQNFER